MDRRQRGWTLVAGAGIVVALAALIWAPPAGEELETPTRRADVRPQERPSAPPKPEPDLGGIVDGLQPTVAVANPDDLVRGAITALSRHPRVTEWLVTDGIARRVVSAVEAVADGYSPRDELSFARPEAPLFVTYEGAQPMITRGSFRRYDLVVEVLESVDPAGVAMAYRRLYPRLEAIHRELPFARGVLHERVLEAVDHLLAVEVPDGPYAVVRQTRTWAFLDPELESLSDAQRHLLRTGPRNARSIQRCLVRVRDAIDAEPETVAGVRSDADGAFEPAAYQEGSEASRSSTP